MNWKEIMKKLLPTLIALVIFFFTPSAFSDGAQTPTPENLTGTSNPNLSTPNTNGTFITTPAALNRALIDQAGPLTTPGNTDTPPTIASPETNQ